MHRMRLKGLLSTTTINQRRSTATMKWDVVVPGLTSIHVIHSRHSHKTRTRVYVDLVLFRYTQFHHSRRGWHARQTELSREQHSDTNGTEP